eukprot:6150975-Pyramimonas_sp.AAC.1
MAPQETEITPASRTTRHIKFFSTCTCDARVTVATGEGACCTKNCCPGVPSPCAYLAGPGDL